VSASGRSAAGRLRALLGSVAVGALLTATACDQGGPSAAQKSLSSPGSSTGAVITSTATLTARLLQLTIQSPAVGGTVGVRLLLPADYARTTRRFPVLYLLHGCCDDYRSWTRYTDVAALSAHTEALIVMPDAGPVGFYTNWLQGPQWETFHLVELRHILEQHFRASDVRAIAGLSMGGLGALSYAARHPGMFRAVASFSGVVDTRLSPQESSGYQQLVRSYGQDPEDLWGDPTTAAATWAAHNPYDLAAKLRGVRIYLSAGTGTPGPLDPDGTAQDSIEASIHAENVAFDHRLRSLHIQVTTDFYGAGTHSWPYWERELGRAWPMLTASLQAS
jgi:diacylglycerol O-acyltransferase/trehalose O-mycolyltransferase